MRKVQVGRVAEQIRGVSYKKDEASDEPGAELVGVLRAGNIQDGALSFSDLVYVPKARVKGDQLLRAGDVLIATSSGSLEVVGKPGVAKEDRPEGFGAFCRVLRPSDDVDASYFGHFFRTVEYRRHVERVAAGANINNLKNEHLSEIEIPLPSLEEQKRIAAILDAADELRKKRRRAIDRLDTLTQSIFHNMFGDPGANPRGYEVKKMIEIVDPKRPITYGILKPGDDVQHGVPYVRVVDMINGSIQQEGLRRTSHEISEQYKRSILASGDLLMSIRGHVGRLAIVNEGIAGANITQDTARLAISGANPTYVLECLRSASLQRWMTAFTKGAAVQGINLGDVKQIPIPLPPQDRQDRFEKVVESAAKSRLQFKQNFAMADLLFKSLQQRAFRGEL